MRIMVFDVPAENGGALSVLHEFYNEFNLDKENDYTFVLSLPELNETKHIKVLNFPWIKKSWIHRIYFDNFVAHKLIEKYNVDKVISLQNVVIPHTKVYQSLFVHNALPFSDYRFRMSDDMMLWTYQNIISKLIFKSIKKADHVIVQANWMKRVISKKLNICDEKIEVKKSKIDFEVTEVFTETKESLSTFFYPASGMIFKNHQVIVDACIQLKESGINDYNVIFTLNGTENKLIAKLYNIVKENKLPIKFVGSMKREEVMRMYSRSILIFPSFIETVGLPLVEAMKHNSPIIASELDYSCEVLTGYNHAFFFSYLNNLDLCRKMEHFITKI